MLSICCSISSSSTFVFLLVGPEEKRLTCHQALHGYYSRCFDGMLYGNCIEARYCVIKLPDDNYEDSAAFVKFAIPAIPVTKMSENHILSNLISIGQYSTPLIFNDYEFYVTS